ncbi:MAG: rRNA pseudouridine synthase [Opitutaceae bacterium]|jgi:23S rRNA pseudouridine2605 synthase|nr:rRNA pseudouridine synthase [Opitutaceae bacterium]
MPESTVRLQKFLADAGICSRRAAEQLISQGEVWVNGRVASLGQKIDPATDKITVEGQQVRSISQPKITVAVHKPRGLICSNDDPHNPETVFTLLPRQFAKYRFFCAGRLDKDSEGLVILTTDGDLAQRLTHPSNLVTKRYHVVLETGFPRTRIPRLLSGITVENERLKVEYANLISPNSAGLATSLDVHMHHGKKREIRQLFLALGHPVKRLRRYQIGAFALKGIPSRAGKQLSPEEIESLFAQPGLAPRPSSVRASAKQPAPRPGSSPRPAGKRLAKTRPAPKS